MTLYGLMMKPIQRFPQFILLLQVWWTLILSYFAFMLSLDVREAGFILDRSPVYLSSLSRADTEKNNWSCLQSQESSIPGRNPCNIQETVCYTHSPAEGVPYTDVKTVCFSEPSLKGRQEHCSEGKWFPHIAFTPALLYLCCLKQNMGHSLSVHFIRNCNLR